MHSTMGASGVGVVIAVDLHLAESAPVAAGAQIEGRIVRCVRAELRFATIGVR